MLVFKKPLQITFPTGSIFLKEIVRNLYQDISFITATLYGTSACYYSGPFAVKPLEIVLILGLKLTLLTMQIRDKSHILKIILYYATSFFPTW